MDAKDTWLRAIEHAARMLEPTSAAPAWLLDAVRRSASYSDILAPEAQREHRPADHFYPH